MREKKIAIYLVASVLTLALIIGITVYMVVGKKQVKKNSSDENIVQTQNSNVENNEVAPREIDKTYQNQIYEINLYTDGTATAKVKSDIVLWGNLKDSTDEKYKNEKKSLNSIITQNRQIDSNNKKIEQVFISKYIGDIYDNYYYGKAIIKCEENTFYLIDLMSDKKIRIQEDWTEKCRETNSDKILSMLQKECLSELVKNENIESNVNYSGVGADNKYKYVACFDENYGYSVFVHSIENDELLLYTTAKIDENTTRVNSGSSYSKFDIVKPNGGVINGTIKKDDTSVQEALEQKEKVIVNSVYIELQDLSTQSDVNYTTNGYIELKNI